MTVQHKNPLPPPFGFKITNTRKSLGQGCGPAPHQGKKEHSKRNWRKIDWRDFKRPVAAAALYKHDTEGNQVNTGCPRNNSIWKEETGKVLYKMLPNQKDS